MADAHFVALPNERYWDRHCLQCDFRFQYTPAPGSVIHSELQMPLIELKLKTSNNVTKCLGLEMDNNQIVASKMIILYIVVTICLLIGLNLQFILRNSATYRLFTNL